jgi:enoyl-CoA hydratase/carnithine racemase
VTLPQDQPTIEYSVSGAIALIRLNRPASLNALTAGMLDLYSTLLLQADADPAVRAIVVTGNGRGFCAGADLSMLSAGPDALRAYIADQDPELGPAMTFRLATPVVTAINGPCAGLGFVIAVCADKRFAHPEATLSTTFSRLGLVAEYGISWVLPRLVGLPAATDLLLTGRTITGREAGELGLADVSEDPLSAAMAWASSIAENCSPTSMAFMKQALLNDGNSTLSDCMVETLQLMLRAFEGDDLQEALNARGEKRPPAFAPWIQ